MLIHRYAIPRLHRYRRKGRVHACSHALSMIPHRSSVRGIPIIFPDQVHLLFLIYILPALVDKHLSIRMDILPQGYRLL